MLATLFFFVAVIYSSVGLGGGSSYTAIMAIFDVNYVLIPTTSLMLNVAVTSVGAANFWRGGHVNWRLITPFLVSSIPMAYLGGLIHLSRQFFYILLLITLTTLAVRIYFFDSLRISLKLESGQKVVFSVVLGGLLGFVAGAVGIGGGIYLVPIIVVFGLGTEKEAAATGSIFIWMNSLSGLLSRMQRGAFDMEMILPLLAAVAVGGYLGSYMGSFRYSPRVVQKVMGIVVVVAIGFLIKRIL
ncbi:MAG: sulfite exporter TauE/SafE family protein [Nitrospinaceae bacterium]|jgi:uncharacterized protein|nr:sulfite exporter TauE/SafE family protein [Nitrospinaceae bacterium]MBT3434178.1 sulfite exporter TauE/SafE family protein [Nitrospinaceae bacterium]MBT3821009.1 sulfite exporter TauE/SafE family protein [Nitrospinaceae bacterium]MBT4432101.1 sulfite exporter TauE/SafE family protein [Nitrospinaceae bacterium]MBT5369493.1 sulfite exporter TauE/SafE family protein [Nitrospinaceae bacterium]